MTGMPEVSVHLIVPSELKIDNYSLHPAVNKRKFVEEQTLKFVPLDGEFVVFSFATRTIKNISPLNLNCFLNKKQGQKYDIEIRMSPKILAPSPQNKLQF